MIVTAIDPRDIRWEVPAPHFRVTFWAGATHAYEHDLADTDVLEALAWAEDNANGRTFTIGAVVPDQGDGPGLVHLAGTDPSVPV
jgi:hypothetical protein